MTPISKENLSSSLFFDAIIYTYAGVTFQIIRSREAS
jgi:hypothetical protein